MRLTLAILSLCAIAACKQPCPQPAFFDRLADTTTHREVFGHDSIFCTEDSVVGYNFYEPAQRRRESENVDKSKPVDIKPLEIAHYLLPSQFWDGKISLKKKGLYAQNKDNREPYLVLPFMPIGYVDTVRYMLCFQTTENKICIVPKHAVKVDDVFFDKQYNDTIYKISYAPDLHMSKRMFDEEKIYFVGKHVGLIGAAAPLWEPTKNRYILYDRIGNFYPQKYNYDTAHYNFM